MLNNLKMYHSPTCLGSNPLEVSLHPPLLGAFSSQACRQLRPSFIGGFPGSTPTFIDGPTGTVLTRSQLKISALSLAYGILHHPSLARFDLKRGDTILISSPNSLAFPVIVFAAAAAGLRVTTANHGYTARELEWQWKDSGAKIAFVHTGVIDVAKAMFASIGMGDEQLVPVGDDLSWALKETEKASNPGVLDFEALLTMGTMDKEEVFDGDLADETFLLCYSSGTTGTPKGVETTHKNLTAVTDMSTVAFPPLDVNSCLLAFLPFFHIYGAIFLVTVPILSGASVVIQARFEPDTCCRYIQDYKITQVMLVPPVLVLLSKHPVVEKYDLSSLVMMITGAAPCGSTLVRQVQDRLNSLRPDTKPKVHIVQGYGLTETSPSTHCQRLDDAHNKPGSIGVLIPNMEARIVSTLDTPTPVDVEDGEGGELWLRGPNVMKGYLNNAAATQESITGDGWFKTGDIAMRDSDGQFWIVDRKKELIKYKGFQVAPAELEALLIAHPLIADVAVIGIECPEQATQLPRAYVVPTNVSSLTTDPEKTAFSKEVALWTQKQVAHHKYLRGGVVIVDKIPKSASGKILRRELRQRAMEEMHIPVSEMTLPSSHSQNIR